MPRGRGRGRGASRGGAVAVRDKMVTRNRGRPRKSYAPEHTHSKAIPRDRNGKRPWEDSDNEAEESKPDFLSSSSDEESDHDMELLDPSFDYDDNDVSMDIDDVQSFSALDDDVIVCPWAEDVKFPPLDLPVPSQDLVIPQTHLMDAIQIYETVTTYFRVIQITPFLFEDFCAALRSADSTKLMADVHIALLKCLFRDDDEEQTIFAVTETSVSFQLLGVFLDAATYAEVLRQYAESDRRFPQEVVQILNRNYPYVSIGERITVLLWLCDRFIQTAIYKKLVKAEGKIQYQELCSECLKAGHVVLCDTCESCYHVKCAGLNDVPSGQWSCPICERQNVHGVTDCLLPGQKPGRQSLRSSPLGYDRHGRVYWFLVRRIVVEDLNRNTTYVYSSLPAIYELLTALDAEYYEARLCRTIYYLLDTIAEQTRTTLSLTRSRRDELSQRFPNVDQPYIDKDNAYRMIYLTYNILYFEEDYVKEEVHTNSTEEFNGPLKLELKKRLIHHLGFKKGRLCDDFWTYGVEERQLVTRRQEFIQAMNLPEDTFIFPIPLGYVKELNIAFRLGFSDMGHQRYENIYDISEVAKPPSQRMKDKDRRKYLNTRFSIDEPFTWAVTKGKEMFGPATLITRHLQITIRRLANRIPVELFHRLWRGKNFEIYLQKLQNSNTIEQLVNQLLQLEAVMRKPIFTTAWWGSLGHTNLVRLTHADRERRQQLDALKKKEDQASTAIDQVEGSDIVVVKYTKMKAVNKILLRLKNEGYRISGKEKLGGWLWMSKMYQREVVQQPPPPPLGIRHDTPFSELKTTGAVKANRLERIVKRLTCWREAQEFQAEMDATTTTKASNQQKQEQQQPICNSQNGGGAGDDHMDIKADIKPYVPETSAIAKAYDPERRRLHLKFLAERGFNGTPGEGKPFRFPTPFQYFHPGAKKRSILVLPPHALKHLAKTGGCRKDDVFGFHALSKTNLNVWNYPCPRPFFDNCWRYMTLNARSLHAVALQLRILYAAIRWADMEPEWEGDDERVVVQHPEYEELRAVISHKEYPPDGYYETYKLQVELVALDDDGIPPQLDGDVVIRTEGPNEGPLTVANRSARKSVRRKSAKKSLESSLYLRNNVHRKVVERWARGVDLKLFEIAKYWKNVYERKQHQHQLQAESGKPPVIRVIRPFNPSFIQPKPPPA